HSAGRDRTHISFERYAQGAYKAGVDSALWMDCPETAAYPFATILALAPELAIHAYWCRCWQIAVPLNGTGFAVPQCVLSNHTSCAVHTGPGSLARMPVLLMSAGAGLQLCFA